MGMGPLGELLATDHRRTLEFFVRGLIDVSDPSVDRQELLYTASVLAHYAQVSTQAAVELPAPVDLGDVFDHFVLDTSMARDGGMMETAGAQCLLLGGFFARQMRRRHSIRWYAELGTGFFNRAAAQEQASLKARLLGAIAQRFEAWRLRYERLSDELRVQRYLLSSPPPSTPGSG